MHEFSLIQSLFDEVDSAVVGLGSCEIMEIGVTCGPLSGVEPALLQFAFDALIGTRYGSRCRLNIDTVPMLIHCNDCQTDFSPESLNLLCPSCSSGRTTVLQGDALILSRITFQEVDAETALISARGAM
jgi:hydrogenase nickel incorporation protein HypA/HybF